MTAPNPNKTARRLGSTVPNRDVFSDWRTVGDPACAGQTAIFDGAGLTEHHLRLALNMCYSCPIRQECYDRADQLDKVSYNGLPGSVWGGMWWGDPPHGRAPWRDVSVKVLRATVGPGHRVRRTREQWEPV